MRLLLLITLAFGPMLMAQAQQSSPRPADRPPAVQDSLSVLDKPEIKKIFERQAKRRPSILNSKNKGLIGESQDGLLKMRTDKGLSQDVKKKLKTLVDMENKDRSRFYKAMSIELKDSTQVERIKNNMFETYLSTDPSGVYYFKDKQWHKKEKK
jgi:hypothetical protein